MPVGVQGLSAEEESSAQALGWRYGEPPRVALAKQTSQNQKLQN